MRGIKHGLALLLGEAVDRVLKIRHRLPPQFKDGPIWDKLDRIEDWLAGPGPSRWPDYVLQAELQLADLLFPQRVDRRIREVADIDARRRGLILAPRARARL